MKKTRFLYIFCVALISLLGFQQCANPVSPTGGPLDEDPPVLLRAVPPMQSVNFRAEKIKLTFDEYVEFKDVNKQLIISPPMLNKPEFRMKQKSIEITFQEELMPNTTYNLFFGNAIVDITEANPLSNFQYVFSTGNVLDSMTFKGSVKDALTHNAIEGVNVMLYLDNNDSIPFDSLPYYIRPYFMSRTNEDGFFQFYNLPDKDFLIFALEDGNSNMIFDQLNERIAFADSLIHPYYKPKIIPADTLGQLDSLGKDTLQPVLKKDSLLLNFVEPDPLDLLMFEEVDSLQRLMKVSLAEPNHIYFIFKHPVHDPKFRVLNVELPNDWMIQELHTHRDTISWWLKTIPADSLEIEISDNQQILDTLKQALIKVSKTRKESTSDKKEVSLKIKFDKSLLFSEPWKLHFHYPIAHFSNDRIMLVEDKDTLYSYLTFTDSLPHQAQLNFQWKENTSYKFEIPDSVFTDLLGQSHDTLRQSFKTPAFADFGNMLIHLKISNPELHYIFQLLKDDKVIKEIKLNKSEDIEIKDLKPGPYRLRLIFDANNNGHWDAGNYIHKVFPEKIVYYPDEITIRANWDIEEDWKL